MIKIKACFARSSVVKDKFEGATCALPISVGQPYHESAKLSATIELINKYFAKCILIVCDSLQRHNVALHYSENEIAAYQKSIHDGSLWIARNENIIKQLKIPYELIRWDKWYKSKEFPVYLEKIEELCHTDTNFSVTINDCADNFVQHHFIYDDKKVFSKSIATQIDSCKNYLKEEAAILLMWHDYENYDFLAYPGSNNKVIASIYDVFNGQYNGKNKLVPLKIKFKNK